MIRVLKNAWKYGQLRILTGYGMAKKNKQKKHDNIDSPKKPTLYSKSK